MLEAVKRKAYTGPDEYLTDADTKALHLWYSRYTSRTEYDIEDIVDLLYFLYIRENIDLYPCDLFQSTVSYLAERHGFERSSFCDILSSFRKLVFNY